MVFGERLKHLREGRYSQEDLAEKLNVNNNTISKWENGSQEPRPKNVAELARVLGTTAAYLLGDTDNPDPAAQRVNSEQSNVAYRRNLEMDSTEGMLYLRNGSFEVRLPDTEKNSELFRSIVTQILTVAGQPIGVDASVNILDGGHSNNYHGNVVAAN